MNILSMIEFIFINSSFSLLWTGHDQLEALCTVDDVIMYFYCISNCLSC